VTTIILDQWSLSPERNPQHRPGMFGMFSAAVFSDFNPYKHISAVSRSGLAIVPATVARDSYAIHFIGAFRSPGAIKSPQDRIRFVECLYGSPLCRSSSLGQ
jgi:hypothetical protein